MTVIIPLPAIIGGIVTALLFAATIHGWIVGITAPFLPLFTFALTGMVYGRAGVSCALVSATLGLLLLIDADRALMLFATQLVPATLFIRALMVAIIRPDPPAFIWASLGHAITMMTLYGAMFYAVMIATENALYTHMIEVIKEQIALGTQALDEQTALMFGTLANDIPHVLLALEYWAWSSLMIGLTLLAHLVADSCNMHRRPTPMLQGTTPPDYVLGLLALCAGTSFFSHLPLVQAGQAASIILLLPYFFSGIGMVHRHVRQMRYPALILVGIYMAIIFTFWPLVIITLYGLLRHLSLYTFSLPSSR